jgi:hypothetical protein
MSGRKIRTAFSHHNLKDLDGDDWDLEDKDEYSEYDDDFDMDIKAALMKGDELNLMTKGRQKSMNVNAYSLRKQSCLEKRTESLLSPVKIQTQPTTLDYEFLTSEIQNTRSIFNPSLFNWYMEQEQLEQLRLPKQADIEKLQQ